VDQSELRLYAQQIDCASKEKRRQVDGLALFFLAVGTTINDNLRCRGL
jgi:hypothetical protein